MLVLLVFVCFVAFCLLPISSEYKLLIILRFCIARGLFAVDNNNNNNNSNNNTQDVKDDICIPIIHGMKSYARVYFESSE